MIQDLQNQQAGLASLRKEMQKDAPDSAPLAGAGSLYSAG